MKSNASTSEAATPTASRPRPFAPGALLFALFMVAAGVGHFVAPEFYLRLMPPWLPWHEELVFLSGVCEVMAGVLVLIPRTRRVGGLFAIAVLLGVFPANVWMAVDPSVWPEVPTWARWLRLPLQAIPILWAWWVAVRAE
ncbi:MAG TPA: hypothetical protein VK858_20790 [Longimicrobiales bacterium]|nr:hypothetical protein [Longimicrobiales bacterium]